MTRRERRLQALIHDHRAAVREFVDRANAIAAAQWLTPRAEGKWTPAQETRHLMLTYEAFSRDLSGGGQMRLRGNRWKRALWRAIGLASILWRKRIPAAVRAPREARPEWESTPRAELLSDFQRRTDEFDELFARIWRNEPRRRVTHPMLGACTLDQVIRLSSVHTRHHAAFLPSRTVA